MQFQRFSNMSSIYLAIMSRNLNVSPFLKQCFVTAAVGFNLISRGCALGYPAILLPQLRRPGSGFQLTKEEESWIASLNALFILVGNVVASPAMDKLGRKGAHYALTIPFIIGWFIIALAKDVKVLFLARAILGMSSGQLNNLRSVLIGECTSPNNRGAFLTTISLTQAFGIFFVHLVGSFYSWQVTALICSFFPFVSLLMTIYISESPSWLARQGRYEECREAFRWLRGEKEEEELTELIKARMELRQENMENRQANENFLRTALQTIVKKDFYKPIILMIHANSLMHFAGGSTMSTYAIIILNLIMGQSANVYFWMVFLDIQRIITNAAAVYVIKRVKRRTMMFTNGAISVIAHLAITVYVHGKLQGWMPPGLESVWLPALLVNIQFFTVGMAMVPMPNIIAGEVFPLEYRGIGGTLSLTSSGVIGFLVLKTFPNLIDAIGLPGTYLIYSVILSYILSIVWILLPETKGKTLQQIEDELRGSSLKPHEIDERQTLQSSIKNIHKNKDQVEKKHSVERLNEL